MSSRSPDTPDTLKLVGRVIGPYLVLDWIGQGGMGEVFRAMHIRMAQQVALKILPQAAWQDLEFRKRFLRGARAAATLKHPHIVRTFEFGEAQLPAGAAGGSRAGASLNGGSNEGSNVARSLAYVAMEFVPGEPLQKVIHDQPLPFAETLRYAYQIAVALAAAHERRIIHRDVKSANVMVLPDGNVKLLDFGIAKPLEPLWSNSGKEPSGGLATTQEGTILGSLYTMAPEQAAGKPADERSDMFSYGVLCYEMVTGRMPFNGNSGVDILNHLMNDEPEAMARFNPELPVAFENLIRRALAKVPASRYPSMRALIADFETFAGPQPTLEATASGAWAALRKKLRK